MRNVLMIGALIAPAVLGAQSTGPAPLRMGDRFFEANAGYSWYSPRGGGWGLITGRRVFLTSLRREWVINEGRQVAWGYVGEWTPLAVVQRVHQGETYTCHDDPQGMWCERDRSAQIAIGTGVSPFGLKMYLNPQGKTRPFAHTAAGGILFSSAVPVHNSTRLNFTAEYGGGLEFVANDGRAGILGFRFHHISNGSFGRVNPGLDANVIYVGFKKRR